MNFYNPYFYSIPGKSVGILSKLSLSSIINGTSKTLNFVNQAIPVIKQISPMMKNAKTMFNVMNEFKKIENPAKKEITNNTKVEEVLTNGNNSPTFFI